MPPTIEPQSSGRHVLPKVRQPAVCCHLVVKLKGVHTLRLALLDNHTVELRTCTTKGGRWFRTVNDAQGMSTVCDVDLCMTKGHPSGRTRAGAFATFSK
jgi:hypothetical protein